VSKNSRRRKVLGPMRPAPEDRGAGGGLWFGHTEVDLGKNVRTPRLRMVPNAMRKGGQHKNEAKLCPFSDG